MGAETSPLSADEACRIIEACSKAKIAELKFRGLELRSHPSVADLLQNVAYPVAALTEKNHNELTQEAIQHEELKTREQQIAEMLITDPAEAERLIAEGDLKDADDESDDDAD